MCYYRVIGATAPFIGTGALKRLAAPEEFAEVVANSKLISERSLVIMGARGDASMYPDEVPKVLEASASSTDCVSLQTSRTESA